MDLVTSTNILVSIAIALGSFSLREMYRHNAILARMVEKDREHDARLAEIQAKQTAADAEVQRLKIKVAQICATMGISFSDTTNN